MGKIYNSYFKLKKENSSTLFLFKSGIFYIFLDEDAKKISELTGLKLAMYNEEIVKCGFPASALNKYTKKFDELNLAYQIIEQNFEKINSTNEYIFQNNALQIIKMIKELNLDNTSPIEALNILIKIKNKLDKE